MFAKKKDDPGKLGFDELLALKQKVDREIAARQDTEVEVLKSKVVAVADALGMAPAELLGIKAEPAERRTKRQVRIKYRDPDQPNNTWSGKGRVPKWLQEKLEQGATKDQYQAQ